jgi:hypothetical protein
MFSVTIVFGPGPMVWTLMYKTIEMANAATASLENCTDPMIVLTDDFGQQAAIVVNQIHGVMFEDLEQSKLAHIERALHQARTKIKADELAMADPVMRAAAQRQQSPILQPMMPAGMPQPNGRYTG